MLEILPLLAVGIVGTFMLGALLVLATKNAGTFMWILALLTIRNIVLSDWEKGHFRLWIVDTFMLGISVLMSIRNAGTFIMGISVLLALRNAGTFMLEISILLAIRNAGTFKIEILTLLPRVSRYFPAGINMALF